jgi:hypothetical protein
MSSLMKCSLRRLLKCLAFSFFIVNLVVSRGSDAHDVSPPDAEVTWIHPLTRNRSPFSFPYFSKWIWKTDHSKFQSKFEMPALKTWISIPKDYLLKRVQASLPEVQASIKNDGYLSFETVSRSTQVELLLSRTMGNVTVKREVDVDVLGTGPQILIHPRCESYPVKIEQKTFSSHFLFLALDCYEEDDHLHLKIFYSLDAHPRNSWSAIKEEKGMGTFETVFKNFRSQYNPAERRTQIGRFYFQGTLDPNSSEFEVYLGQEHIYGSLQSNLGLGLTSFSYNQYPTEASIDQVGVTPKVNVGYHFSKYIELSFNAHLTLAALNLRSTPDNAPIARHYGSNARLGYLLPSVSDTPQWRVYAGVYALGMMVLDEVYGIESVYGPQVLLSISSLGFQNSKKRSSMWTQARWSAYVKLGTTFSRHKVVSLKNHDIGVGATYQINSPESWRAIMLTLDYSKSAYWSADDTAHAFYDTLSLGVSTSLW